MRKLSYMAFLHSHYCQLVENLPDSWVDKTLPLFGDHAVEMVSLRDCTHCNNTVAMETNDEWRPLEDCLTDDSVQTTCVKQVNCHSDRVMLFILGQIYHNQCDLDLGDGSSPFLPHPPGEFARLLWTKQQAVGFYTVKTKGSPVSGSYLDTYCLPVLDTMYIRKDFRGRGLGQMLIQDLVTQFSDQDVGFSHPVSDGLYKALGTYLKGQRSLRDKLWECTHGGEEGNRRNIWLHLKRCFNMGRITDISNA